MAQLWHIDISQPTLTRLAEDQIQSQKKPYGHIQQDEAKRAAFLSELGDPTAFHLVYVVCLWWGEALIFNCLSHSYFCESPAKPSFHKNNCGLLMWLTEAVTAVIPQLQPGE
jgi:hypothetical protein